MTRTLIYVSCRRSRLGQHLVLGLTMPAPAARPVTHRKAIWGPLEYGGHSAFPTYAHLGAGIFQWRLDWNGVALQRPAHPRDPADPAYRWPVAIDPAVAESRRYGIAVSLAVVGTPVWANGGRDARWAPNRPADYADFVYAAAKRYPGVRYWMVWMEPTKSTNFQPLTPDGGGRLSRAGRRGPRTYARMLDAAYGALKKLNRHNKVIGGNTFTTGTISPRNWMRAMQTPERQAAKNGPLRTQSVHGSSAPMGPIRRSGADGPTSTTSGCSGAG